METFHHIDVIRNTCRRWRRDGLRVAFVPTMGNLHAGHLRLVEEARAAADRVVASVFVNPLQFGPQEDFATYPRTLEDDSAQLRRAGADALFAPGDNEMYPDGREWVTRVTVPGLSDILCGATRPGFFTGVATVVAKLLHSVEPDMALFGEKDYQQLLVIRRMVRDLNLDIEIRGVPTVRERDGLAMSSRNGYLDAAQRSIAPQLYRALVDIRVQLQRGERDYAALERAGAARLERAGFRPDYVSIRRQGDLEPASDPDEALIVLAAAWLGQARLIDNLKV